MSRLPPPFCSTKPCDSDDRKCGMFECECKKSDEPHSTFFTPHSAFRTEFTRRGGHSSYFFTTQIFRNRTGLPWFCKKSGPLPGASVEAPPGVLSFGSRLSWMTTPLSLIVTLALLVRLPSTSNRAPVISTSYVCQANGGKHMFTIGLAIW